MEYVLKGSITRAASGGVTIGLDETLTIRGMAADAKAVGDKIDETAEQLRSEITAGAKGEPGDPGKDGADGYTPVKGVDYFTAEDKEGIAEEVLEIIPATTAISFDLANGKFTETINGEIVSHSVTFDSEGRPIKIDNTTITWG